MPPVWVFETTHPLGQCWLTPPITRPAYSPPQAIERAFVPDICKATSMDLGFDLAALNEVSATAMLHPRGRGTDCQGLMPREGCCQIWPERLVKILIRSS